MKTDITPVADQPTEEETEKTNEDAPEDKTEE